MNSPKLLEAIAELEAQRAIIDDAILHLKKAHQALNGTQEGVSKSLTDNPLADMSRRTRRSARASFVNEAVDAISTAGHALHINAIVGHIKSVRGSAPARTSVQASLAREQERAKEANRLPRVVKVGRSTFDVYRTAQSKVLDSKLVY